MKVITRMLALGLVTAASLANAQAPRTSFDTPQAAVEAFAAALERGDAAALGGLLGPGSESLVSSGDAVQDAADRKEFLDAYRTRSAIVEESKDRRRLVIGGNDWPFPVPLVKRESRWMFDGEAGVDELIYRRIGANELGAIAVCRGFVEAQNEYASEGREGDPAGLYAMKLLSDPGRQNGLHWPTAAGEPPSPAGAFVANAAAEGYRRGPAAYHGYRYRMLYRQGRNAVGGARDYFKNGVLTQGFALVAWPAEYGVSGIMTFVVNHDGDVFQRDLGTETEARVAAMSAYDPDRSWRRVE
jgi:hypothetical protein